MHALRAFDEAPLDYILPENLPVMLGVRDGAIAATLASSRLLRPAINRRIRSELPPLPDAFPSANDRLLAELALESAAELDQLCRVMSVLINRRAILATTSGAVLREIVAWCGDQALIFSLHDARFPDFLEFEVLSVASHELLDAYALRLKAHLLGTLPPAYRKRLELRLASEQLCEPLTFVPGDPDEACFMEYVALARRYRDAKN